MRSLTDVGRVVERLGEVAGDSLHVRDMHLGVRDLEPLNREARLLAVKDAQNRATELASAAGLPLGGTTSIQDGPDAAPIRSCAMAASGGARQPMPVEPGVLSVTASVAISYSIAD